MANEEPIALQVAHVPVGDFRPLDPEAFGEAVTRQLIGRPLETVRLFRDAATARTTLALEFAGVPGTLRPQALLVSASPTDRLPFAELDQLLLDGGVAGAIQHLSPQEAQHTASPAPDPRMEGRLDALGQLRGHAVHVAATIATLVSDEPIDPGRRLELASLLQPILSTFEGTIAAELARRQAGPESPKP